eukprot:CAMPEP_0119039956 /NCGR_PEP_ID=MMETSP1177-20130426/9734_1 /TAXON_ID=2985 /ORGANISM="Ochromonas sp, Strain CCMP1899" /LENGTH=558 /DNA_ID=CAMNT_0007004517 /DNA_START=218 /DNA_END=1894 /DNA_ORIENTATION=-
MSKSETPTVMDSEGLVSYEEGEYFDDGDEEEFEEDDRDGFERVKKVGKPLGNNDQEWMFFDVAKINVKGGEGGDGCMAMRREFRIEFGGPSGGNGGSGGSVWLLCDSTINTLSMLRRRVHHRGKDGTNGKGDSRHGIKGDDSIVIVPPGTIVRDQDGVLAGELNQHGQKLLVAKGGKGGRGNEHFKSARMTAPAFSERGELGGERWINVELKLVADVGFIGMPNAGKSTLLAASSNAKPKIADYAFTTIVPNLGVCDIDGRLDEVGKGLVLVDIPGLLEGAHDGVGMGIAFLRHVQRCRVIVHVIRGDSEDPVGDFIAIQQELELFNPKLAQKMQVVVINKIDIPEVQEKLEELTKGIKKAAGHSRVLGISAATGERVKELMIRVRKVVESLPTQTDYELFTEEEERVNFDDEMTDKFEVFTDDNFPGQFRVAGDKIEKVAETMNWDYYESVQRFHRILDAQGISEALKDEGAVEGDLVMIGEWDFTYNDRKNRWLSELGLEDVKPRQRRSPGGEGENHEEYQEKEMSTYAKIEQELRESGTMLDNIPAREVVGRKRK